MTSRTDPNATHHEGCECHEEAMAEEIKASLKSHCDCANRIGMCKACAVLDQFQGEYREARKALEVQRD